MAKLMLRMLMLMLPPRIPQVSFIPQIFFALVSWALAGVFTCPERVSLRVLKGSLLCLASVPRAVSWALVGLFDTKTEKYGSLGCLKRVS